MLLTMSSTFLFSAFICYLIGTLLFGGAITRHKKEEGHTGKRFEKWAVLVTTIGFGANVCYFISRWFATGHAPVSNMFEFTTAFGMFIVGAFLILYNMYRIPTVGVVALPIAVLLIAYASMFSRDVTPLIPALKSNWLTIHVMTTVLGEAILAVSAFAGLAYLLKIYDGKQRKKGSRVLEFLLYLLVVVLGFVVSTTIFTISNYEASYEYVSKDAQHQEIVYHMPALIGMHEQTTQSDAAMESIVNTPDWINGKKANTVLWSMIVGSLLYGLIRLSLKKSLTALLHPFAKKVSLRVADEMNYRAVLIGFPIFTLGALLFAMIWAQIAWSRFWGWDPKEVWALVTWLYYAAFLHLRLSKGWEGEKSAWLAVIGFGIIMFNLIAVNLILAGLHSYAA